MDPKTVFLSQFPEATVLELRKSDALTRYLRQQNWLAKGETVTAVEKPGEGNMNFVMRVITNRRSFILKQAYPWVYKFPQVPAPITRGKMEAIFYQLTEDDPVLTGYAPSLIGFDSENHVLAQQDLGTGADFTFLYTSSEFMTVAQLQHLLLFLSHLHTIQATPDEARSLENRSMRELNHEHIFRYPFDKNNGLDLDAVVPGLQKVAASYQQHTSLIRRITELGDLYLQNGNTLIHGDYYPGSWLRTADGVRIIDPEFGFFGQAEFDVGVMLAHAMVSRDEVYTPAAVLAHYQASATFDEQLAEAFAGAEVLRRLLGLAQLPLTYSLAEREALLEQAVAKL